MTASAHPENGRGDGARLAATADAEIEWQSVMARCHDLLPYFAELQLNVTATRVACSLGIARADALRALLIGRRLPPFRVMRDWYYIVRLVERFGGGQSIADWALRRGDSPSVYYRLVRQVTGQPWRVVAARGPGDAKVHALRFWGPHLVQRKEI